MIFFRTGKNAVCYIDGSKVIGIEEYAHAVPPHGWFQGSKILLEGGGEMLVQSNPREVMAAIEAEVKLKQVGWYNLKRRRFCYIVEKEWSPVTYSGFTVPVYIKE